MLRRIEALGQSIDGIGEKVSNFGRHLESVSQQVQRTQLERDAGIIKEWWYTQISDISHPKLARKILQERTERGIDIFQRARIIAKEKFDIVEIAPGLLLFEDGAMVNEYAHSTEDNTELSAKITECRLNHSILPLGFTSRS